MQRMTDFFSSGRCALPRAVSTIVATMAIAGGAVQAAGCQRGSPPLAPLPPGGHHILFIGNSLTYVNGLPATVAAIGASAGDTIRVTTVAGPNLALIDHLNGATNAVAALRLGGWEYVVLQQGPTPRGICRDSLILWTRMFDPLHPRRRCTSGAVHDVAGRRPTVDLRRCAHLVSVRGAGRRRRVSSGRRGMALRLDRRLDDRALRTRWLHPSEIGTFLAALEIYERLTEHDARLLRAQAFSAGRALPLPAETVRLLQRAAHDANARFPAQLGGAPGPNGGASQVLRLVNRLSATTC
jgi:hypothetical protein